MSPCTRSIISICIPPFPYLTVVFALSLSNFFSLFSFTFFFHLVTLYYCPPHDSFFIKTEVSPSWTSTHLHINLGTTLKILGRVVCVCVSFLLSCPLHEIPPQSFWKPILSGMRHSYFPLLYFVSSRVIQQFLMLSTQFLVV